MPLYGEAKRAYQRKWVAARRQKWLEDKQCAFCGAKERLEIDHVDPTQKVNHRIWSWSWARIHKELEKCQVLCVPCHDNKTAEQRKARVPHGTYAMRYHYGCTCEVCREFVREDKRQSRARILSARGLVR
jgi:5-methylcytosine-specific restriction endonuclease McrA